MAKHRHLMERWRKYKTKARRTRPRSFSTKGMGQISKAGPNVMKDAGVNAYGHRGRSFAGWDQEALSLLFKIPHNPTIRYSDDPWLANLQKIDYIKNPDVLVRVKDFNCIFVKGEVDSEASIRFFFGGHEYFFVEKRLSLMRRSIIYSDRDYAIAQLNNNRIAWKPFIRISSSPQLGLDSLSSE